MKSKQTQGYKSPPDIDQNYKLNMPLQQNNVNESRVSSRRVLNFDKSINENSINAGKIIKNNEDNEIYSMYQNQVKQLRDSKNGSVIQRNSINITKYDKSNRHINQNRQMLNRVDEENISYTSNQNQDGYQSKQSVKRNLPAPYYGQESVHRSIEIINNTHGRKANRYDQQVISSNKFVPQDYIQANQFGAHTNQIQRSTEFTFVGNRKHISSPNAHLAQVEAVCSSRQSITLNPLIEENTVSTTKKQASFNREYIMNHHNMDNEYINTNQQYAQHMTDNMSYHPHQELVKSEEEIDPNQYMQHQVCPVKHRTILITASFYQQYLYHL